MLPHAHDISLIVMMSGNKINVISYIDIRELSAELSPPSILSDAHDFNNIGAMERNAKVLIITYKDAGLAVTIRKIKNTEI